MQQSRNNEEISGESDEDVQVDDNQGSEINDTHDSNDINDIHVMDENANNWDLIIKNQVIHHIKQKNEEHLKFSKFTIENLIKK